MPKLSTTPTHIKPFEFHGIELEERGKQAIGDCPFCGKEGKFSVEVATGLWRCFVCQEGSANGGGNVLTFIRLLWKRSDEVTQDYEEIATDRKLLESETVMHWALARSTTTLDWIVPGYDHEGKIVQLYRYLRNPTTGRARWMPTPGLGHGLHGVNLFDRSKSDLFLCEGLWDGMALWETLRKTKGSPEEGWHLTAVESSSILSRANVIAVQSCGAVGSPMEKWLPLFSGKRIFLLFDSDHPRVHEGKEIPPAGWSAMKRATAILAKCEQPPELHYLHWGDGGFDPRFVSGFDVRDWMTVGPAEHDQAIRCEAAGALLGKLRPIPEDWTGAKTVSSERKHGNIEPVPCSSWKRLVSAWRKAMHWRQSMEDVLAVMLSVALSTERIGDQLFLQVIGDAGSGKTRFCDAMLVSRHCHALEHLTGFHSGWKNGEGKDGEFSLLSRINRKTLITPEGDVLMSNPRMQEIMSQQRRIFDGTAGASYKNMKEDLRWTGLRTPWIIAGTPALLDIDHSRLGDRFLRVCFDPPSDDEKRAILRTVGFTAIQAVLTEHNCSASSSLSAEFLEAYQLTGGFINHLRSNASELLAGVNADEEKLIEQCSALGEFTALMRSRPHPDHKRDVEDTKELPTRLMHQFVRLAYCLAAVTGSREIDAGVMRRVKKVATDTARGKTLTIARHLAKTGDEGMFALVLSTLTGHSEERETTLLRFMRKIGTVIGFRPKGGVQQKWRLSSKMQSLWKQVQEI